MARDRDCSGLYNRAAYLERRRELAVVWADKLTETLPPPTILVRRPAKETGEFSRRRVPAELSAGFRFPQVAQAG